MKTKNAVLGNGIGLRPVHYPEIFRKKPKVDWFEIITENFMDTQGRPVQILEKIRKDYAIVFHGVSLSIGSLDPIPLKYIEHLKILMNRIQPSVISDHLCWTSFGGNNLHDLLPLPYTEEALSHVCERIDLIQNELKRSIVLENPSTYMSYSENTMPEWVFLREVAMRSGCGILLDINNVYVNAFNHQFDPWLYISSLPAEKISYMHLAGHSHRETYLFDTHDQPIADEVWDLYRRTISLIGNCNTLIEWDGNIPPLTELMNYVEKAKSYQTLGVQNVA